MIQQKHMTTTNTRVSIRCLVSLCLSSSKNGWSKLMYSKKFGCQSQSILTKSTLTYLNATFSCQFHSGTPTRRSILRARLWFWFKELERLERVFGPDLSALTKVLRQVLCCQWLTFAKRKESQCWSWIPTTTGTHKQEQLSPTTKQWRNMLVSFGKNMF